MGEGSKGEQIDSGKESENWLTVREQVGSQGWMDREEWRERERESVYPWQLVDPIKADWLVNETREARVLVPTGLFFRSLPHSAPAVKDNKEANE